MAERLLRGGDAFEPDARELLRFSSGVVERARGLEPGAHGWLARPRIFLGLTAAAGALAAVLLVVRPGGPGGDDLALPEGSRVFVARGADDAPVWVRVLCHTRDVSGRPLVRSVGDERDPAALSACPPGGFFLFAAQTRAPGWLAGVAERESGEPVALPNAGAVRLEPGPGAAPLPFEVPVDSGAVRVVFFFVADAPRGDAREVAGEISAVAEEAQAERRQGTPWLEIGERLRHRGVLVWVRELEGTAGRPPEDRPGLGPDGEEKTGASP